MTLVAAGPSPVAERFASDLGVFGDRIAVLEGGGAISYAELDERVAELTARLGRERRLILVGAANNADALVAYLAALRGRHPVLLVPGDNGDTVAALTAAYDPDVVITEAQGWEVGERHRCSAHDLHPDLALLLSTSGSTGSAKLVRLSHRNLEANAESIAQYLGITGRDRAVTTLPMQYCYGLSVVNSHLLRGAGLVLTDLSVVDSCFWDLFSASGATSFAGVPHTFELLDRVGFESMSLPGLRCVTQAGGRLDPDKVRRYAAIGERRGWQFFVMYGQTEATARMAYLPPERASSHPQTIGVAIPGGSFRIDAPDRDGVGELVYRGPNVMLGYAERPDELAMGATVEELHTGDLARVVDGDLYQVVGRRSRFIKLFGLRVDLDKIEALISSEGVDNMCTGDDEGLVIAVEPGGDARAVARLVSGRVGVPVKAIRVLEFAELPLTANGKPDYVAVRERATGAAAATAGGTGPVDGGGGTDRRAAVRAVFEESLGTEASDDDSFVGLGGDSLSYVEMSIRLERILGFLPRDWHTARIADLVPSPKRRRLTRQLETSVILRAVAIVLIVGTHSRLWKLPGGAHVLVGVAGFNFARFQLRSAGTMVASVARIALPGTFWIAGLAVVSERFGREHVLLLNSLFGVPDGPREYWFIQSMVLILLFLAALFSIGPVRRLEQRRPFAFILILVVVALAFRFEFFGVESTRYWLSRPHSIFWMFALGWAAMRATTPGRRLLVSALIVATVPGFFGDSHRDLMVMGGLLLVLWLRTLPVPLLVDRLVGPVAGASLYIYLTHFQVYQPLVRTGGPLLACLGSVLAGVALHRFAAPLMDRLEDRLLARTSRIRR